jgi:hypothetical protein
MSYEQEAVKSIHLSFSYNGSADNETTWKSRTSRSGTDVMIFKIFSPKNIAKKLAFLTQNKAKLCKILIIKLVFEKNANFFAENWQKSLKIVIIISIPGNCVHLPKLRFTSTPKFRGFGFTNFAMLLFAKLAFLVCLLLKNKQML